MKVMITIDLGEAVRATQDTAYTTLYDMLKFRTKDEIDQLALDRTPTYRSATAGYTRPLNEHFQISADATMTNVTGTVTGHSSLDLPLTGGTLTGGVNNTRPLTASNNTIVGASVASNRITLPIGYYYIDITAISGSAVASQPRGCSIASFATARR